MKKIMIGKQTKHIFIGGSTHVDIYWRRESRKVICQEVDALLTSI